MPPRRTQQPKEARPPIKADSEKYTVKRKIADNLLSLQVGDSIVVKVMGTPRSLGGNVNRWENGKPPVVIPIEKQPDGESFLLILQTVLESKFEVLGEDAIGKLFLIEAGAEVPGKRYRAFDVSEVE